MCELGGADESPVVDTNTVMNFVLLTDAAEN